MSGFLEVNLRDPRSHDPGCLEICRDEEEEIVDIGGGFFRMYLNV